MKLKTLIFLIIFSGTAFAQEDSLVWDDHNELIRTPDGEITNVMLSFVLYDTSEELNKAAAEYWAEYYPTLEFEGGLDAFSLCDRNLETNLAWCDIHTLRPMYIDGYNTWTLGHEVWHGVYGPNIHE